MLDFDENFFDDEERDGFLVPSKMKRAWAVEMEVMSEIDRICQTYGIKYFLDGGSLLGAIRHKGFIPWDDDIDIVLLREDYNRLIRVLPSEMPEGYFLSSMYTDTEHNQPTSALMNTKYILTDPKKIDRFYGCRYICGIDIAPLDYMPRDPEDLRLFINLYTATYDAAQNFYHYRDEGKADEYIAKIEELCNVKIKRDGTERNQLWKLNDAVSSMYEPDECDYVTRMPLVAVERPDFKYRKEWFDEVIYAKFEKLEFAIPKNYHEMLTVIFGDYMTPVKNASLHDYPFYKGQDEFLKEHGIE